MDRVKQLQEIHDQSLELFKKKNQDYGDAFAKYGTLGILVRISDKLQRFQTITKNQITLVKDEKLEDTLHNYSAMALMLLKEN